MKCQFCKKEINMSDLNQYAKVVLWDISKRERFNYHRSCWNEKARKIMKGGAI